MSTTSFQTKKNVESSVASLMTEKEYTESIVNKLTEDIEQLILKSKEIEHDIEIKKLELDNTRLKREQLESRIKKLRSENRVLSTDRYGSHIRIGDTIEIANKHTNFSEWHSVKSIHNSRRGATRNIVDYDLDKFGVLYDIQPFDNGVSVGTKVLFTTDSGKDTWRSSKKIIIHHGERGVYIHDRQSVNKQNGGRRTRTKAENAN